MYSFQCGACGQGISVQNADLGKVVACPLCKARLIANLPKKSPPPLPAGCSNSDLSPAESRMEFLEYEYGFQYSTAFVAGITKQNYDGVHRQRIIANCLIGENISLVFENSNAFSANAVQLQRTNGEVIGYLPDKHEDDWATHVRDCVEEEILFDAYISQIEEKGREVFEHLPPGKTILTVKLFMIEFSWEYWQFASEYIECVLNDQNIQPLYRKSEDLRTRVHIAIS